MKRFFAVVLIVLMLAPICPTVKAETYAPTRTINLVYDDSGSMIRVGSAYVDTWCQAKYAMEVFAAMLGERETLNIYYMSDYVDGSMTAPPKLTLVGSKDASVTEANVKMIHDLVTDASDTPFDSVKKAYNDLKNVNSDERWLVVLTDGEFNGTSNSRVENYFHECVADGKTRVMMLSMGPNAAVITPNPDKHIYFEKAENTTDILSKLTRICNRIFQSNALPISNNEISFNVPMSQLVVFAQGKNVKIEGITSSDGKNIGTSSNVHVQYSQTATTDKNYSQSKIIVADNLNGYVATYNTAFEPGNYKVNVTGADDIQVYYKPNVSIAAYLFNEDNEEVTAKDNLVAGTYRLEFGFINGTNGEKVTDTSLLGNIVYKSSFVNTTLSGEKIEIAANSGDMVTIKEGKLDIAVTAQFLEYNVVRANLSYQVYSKNDLIFALEEKPNYSCFVGADVPMLLSVKRDSGEGLVDLTKDQWDLMEIPTVTTTAELGDFKVEKTEEIGKFKIYPSLKDNNPVNNAEIPINIKGGFTQGLSSAHGSLDSTFAITSNELVFSFCEKPKYTLNVDGFENGDEPMILTVKINNGSSIVDLTEEQWNLLGKPTITTEADMGQFEIKKTDEIGKYEVYPTLKDDDPMKTAAGDVNVKVEGHFDQGLSYAEGNSEEKIEINNTITFFERMVDWLKENWLKLTFWIAAILLILGYIPPFKKYLPRKLKKRPIIECSAEKIGVKDKEVHGKFKRKIITTLIPYKAESGFVVFSPSPYKKTAQLRAAGGNGIYVTNMKMFAGKGEISFNGMSIDAGRVKPYRIGANSTISLRTPEYTYTCYLNR